MAAIEGLPIDLEHQVTPAEEVILHLLRDRLPPEVQVQTLVRDEQDFPFVLVRRDPTYGYWSGDPRFIDSARISVQSFVKGENGDEDAGDLLTYCADLLFEESQLRRVIPGKGHLLASLIVNSPRRAADWATATGPVQYADLPQGVWRYEMTLAVSTRKPVKRRQTP